MFESRVVLDGSQTIIIVSVAAAVFESRVVLDGSQTGGHGSTHVDLFESRVVLDGSQTEPPPETGEEGLRVVLF